MDHNPAVGHALDILRLLARHLEPLPAARIARSVGIPRSSAYRILATLADRGFVSHLRESGRFGLGAAAYELGSAYQRQGPLQREAAPVLARLVDQTTHNAHLAVMHGRDVLYVVEERAAGRPRLVTDVGVRLPASLTASGLAMLSALPAAQVRALYPRAELLVQREGRGPATLTALRRELVAVRTRGYAAEDGSISTGLASVALPVLDHGGHPIAAVAVTYPSDTVSDEQVEALVERIRRAVAAITARVT
ncbi:MAG TPA: IclR family transcriptional regulator [Dermatophilaceae bacterium]|nr:IclR family transcriptional regulator [Dermatophilaceae bacterium]